MNKSLTSAHMKRSRLRNLYLKDKTEASRIAYIKQRNCCASLLGKTKKDHYANLDEKDVADNKQFWKTVKPLLSNKVKFSEKITLVEGEEIITEDGENAEILKVQSCKLYNSKYMIASTQITKTEIFTFIAVLVFKLLSRKVLFVNRKDNRNC